MLSGESRQSEIFDFCKMDFLCLHSMEFSWIIKTTKKTFFLNEKLCKMEWKFTVVLTDAKNAEKWKKFRQTKKLFFLLQF